MTSIPADWQEVVDRNNALTAIFYNDDPLAMDPHDELIKIGVMPDAKVVVMWASTWSETEFVVALRQLRQPRESEVTKLWFKGDHRYTDFTTNEAIGLCSDPSQSSRLERLIAISAYVDGSNFHVHGGWRLADSGIVLAQITGTRLPEGKEIDYIKKSGTPFVQRALDGILELAATQVPRMIETQLGGQALERQLTD